MKGPSKTFKWKVVVCIKQDILKRRMGLGRGSTGGSGEACVEGWGGEADQKSAWVGLWGNSRALNELVLFFWQLGRLDFCHQE